MEVADLAFGVTYPPVDVSLLDLRSRCVPSQVATVIERERVLPADLEAAGGRVLGREVTIEAGGVRTRPDLFVESPSGQQAFLEIKTGASAGLTPNQTAVFPLIWTQGGIPRGANAAAAGFIMDGTLARQYPETAGQPVDVQLNCCEAPSGEFAMILDHAARQLQRLGVGLRVNVTAVQLTH